MEEGYIELKAGDILQKGDEYSTMRIWRTVPDFMIGDVIPEGSNGTLWRRSEGNTKARKKKKHWWGL